MMWALGSASAAAEPPQQRPATQMLEQTFANEPPAATLLQSPQEIKLHAAARAAFVPTTDAAAVTRIYAADDDEVAESSSYARLHALKAAELRSLLAKLGLPTHGTKTQLVARLTGSHADAPL
jgi:hypothetical protein